MRAMSGHLSSGDLTVDLLRSLFKNLQQFRAYHEDAGLEVITGPGGVQWSIWDVEALYEASQSMLSPRQAQAIRMFLVEGMFEADAAERMGVSRTNPIGMYAADGLVRLITLVDDRMIRGFRYGG
jgi:hypothetical protein